MCQLSIREQSVQERQEPESSLQGDLDALMAPEGVLGVLLEGKSPRAEKYIRAGLKDLAGFIRAPGILDAVEAVQVAGFDARMRLVHAYRYHLVRGDLPIPTANRRLSTLRIVLKITSPLHYSLWRVLLSRITPEHRRLHLKRQEAGDNDIPDMGMEVVTSGQWADELGFPWAKGFKEQALKESQERIDRMMEEEYRLQDSLKASPLQLAKGLGPFKGQWGVMFSPCKRR